MLDALIEDARADDNVVGVVVFGSRSKGAYVTEASDWDVFVVVREVRGDRPYVRGSGLELVELTVEQLRSPPERRRYALAWVEPQLDKTGDAEAIARGHGLGAVIDGWEPDVAWLRGE